MLTNVKRHRPAEIDSKQRKYAAGSIYVNKQCVVLLPESDRPLI